MVRQDSNDLSESKDFTSAHFFDANGLVREISYSHVTRFFPALEFLKEIAAKSSDGEPFRNVRRWLPELAILTWLVEDCCEGSSKPWKLTSCFTILVRALCLCQKAARHNI